MPARVYLVGAGPGDPGLITLKGVECLRRADVVLYDYLANSQLLEHVPAGAERVCLGRHGGGRLMTQPEVNALMVASAQAGKTVVRLKGGDPMVFAHAGEEIEALEQADVEFEVVPGITVALAAGSYAAVPVTHRDVASAVALVTAKQRSGPGSPRLDYEALARFPGTLVFYMGVTTADRWTGDLIDAGMSGSTPAAIIRRCSWPDQSVERCTLGEVAERIEQAHLRPPVIVVIGNSVGLDAGVHWFSERPLFGQRIVVTRPEDQALTLRDRLQSLGAEVLVQPVIAIEPAADAAALDDAIGRVSEFDWVVFSSANGVRYFFDRLYAGGGDARRLGAVKLAAIGPGTAAELARYHLHADLQPEEYRAESLAEALLEQPDAATFLLVRASRGREVLSERLLDAGKRVHQVVAYSSRDVTEANAQIAQAIRDGEVDWVTVTSSAIARATVALFGDALTATRLASISPLTSSALRELGQEPAVEATQYDMPGLVDAVLKVERRESAAQPD